MHSSAATTTTSVGIQLGKYVILSQSFPRHLLHHPIHRIYKNFNQKPGLTCFQLNLNSKDYNDDENVKVDNGENNIYVTTWSGSSLVLEKQQPNSLTNDNNDNDDDNDGEDNNKNSRLTIADCMPHLNLRYHSNNKNNNNWKQTMDETVECKSEESSLLLLEEEKKNSSIAVLISHGGRFAGGIFDCRFRSEKELKQMSKVTIADALAHKTFHKYTVRKKQGKRQMNFDKSGGGGASTVGSQMRRNNEVLFQEELTELLTVEWSEMLSQCEHIFIHAPGVYNSQQLKSVLPDSVPVTAIPFRVLKPTYQQVLIAFKRLMTVHIFEESQMQQIKNELEQEDQENSGAVLSPAYREESSEEELEEQQTSNEMEKHRIDYEYYRMMSQLSSSYSDDARTDTEESETPASAASATASARTPKSALDALLSASPMTSPLVSALLFPTMGRFDGQEFTPTPQSAQIKSQFWDRALGHSEKKTIAKKPSQEPKKEIVIQSAYNFSLPAITAAVVGGVFALLWR